MAIFGAAEVNGLESLLTFIGIIAAIFVFIKFCSWAKGFELAPGVKKAIFIITGIGLIVFNVLYSMGNKLAAEGDWNMATIALVGSLVWVLIFAFTLMTETKAEAE